MYWVPGDYLGTCTASPMLSSCQPQVLTLLRLIVQLLGYSFDDHFSDKSRQYPSPDDDFDFVIVGAGAAGCVLANRLSEVKNWKILLLEAGDEEPAVANVPALARILRLSSIDYAYHTQPEFTGLGNVSYYWPRGRVMGGSSTINTMWYVRGHKQDYDDWARLGNPGWSYDEVLPYFKKSEDARDPEVFIRSPETHSKGGYMAVERYPYQDKNTKIIRNAWREMGFAETDYNSGVQFGMSKLQFNTIHGTHQSANGAFLRPIRGSRPNLTIRTNSKVVKIIIDPDSKRAVGVQYLDSKSRLISMLAKKEVIISAGSVESPKLLMLSGIGPAEELVQADIPLLKDLPVGRNLLDHPILYPFTFKLNEQASTLVSVDKMRDDLIYWLSSHQGPLSAIGSMDAIAYYQNCQKCFGRADIQFGFTGFISEVEKKTSDLKFIPSSYYDEVKVSLTLLTPKSRGILTLNKTEPVLGLPLIYANYLGHPQDMKTILSGIRAMIGITRSTTLRENGFEYSTVSEPGCENHVFESEEYFKCLVRKSLNSAFHIGGTCRMGPVGDPDAVVNPRLQVHGINGLRVIDGSIMPSLPRANTYAATIMVAEKGSDMIKQDWLPIMTATYNLWDYLSKPNGRIYVAQYF